MVQTANRSTLEALRIGQASVELDRIRSTPYTVPIGFDIETTGKNPRENKMVMVQLKPRGKKPLLIDARDEDRGALRDALLPLLRDHKRVFIGQNLLFELHWMLSYLGMEVNDLRARFEDTMLRELVILGLGFGDAYKRGLAVSMGALGEHYGIPVHKEEQSWFINLDKPRQFYSDGSYSFETDRGLVWFNGDHTVYVAEQGKEPATVDFLFQSVRQWSSPFPQKILEYARQDVSVVHLIHDKQQELIDEYGLQKVVDLESRVLAATAGMQHYGLSVDREKWMGIIQGIRQRADELTAQLHEVVDVVVLEHRRQEWLKKSEPYQEWVKKRDEALDVLKYTWEHTGSQLMQDYGDGIEVYKGWGDFKTKGMQRWKEANPAPKSPGPLKQGVNLGSSDQMQVAFRSRGHQLDSVKEEVLTPLAERDPIIQLYLDYKKHDTTTTKYGLNYLDEHALTGILYSLIQQIGAETGRFSFKEPNIQQIPSKGVGAILRTAVVPRPGYVFIDADFTNVELLITAYITRDPVMLKAFADGADLHARTAEVMFDLLHNPEYLAALEQGITPKTWTDEHDAVVAGRTLAGVSYRSIAKTINFGLLYGMGAGKLASKLRIPIEAARQLMRLYRETYEVAVRWLRRQGDKVDHPDKDGRVYARTLAGRRRWFTLPVLELDKNVTAQESMEALEKHNARIAEIKRQLGNHPIQGTSAEITKLAIALWQERYNSPQMRLVATIHDELLLEVVNEPELIELANQRLGEVMHEALTHFLKGMETKIPVGKVSDYWRH